MVEFGIFMLVVFACYQVIYNHSLRIVERRDGVYLRYSVKVTDHFERKMIEEVKLKLIYKKEVDEYYY